MTATPKVFLYAEFQVSAPFGEAVWSNANPAMQNITGLLSKTWLSGINTNTVGGFYAFDTEANARAYAQGRLADFANAAGGSLTVKLFDGESTEKASRGMRSPFYA